MILACAVLTQLADPAWSSDVHKVSAASHAQVCERHIAAAAQRHNVPVAVLYAVGLTETGRRGQLSPYALNVEGKSFFAKDHREAMAIFDRARRNGDVLIDLGCMQINHYYHASEFQSVAQMFDPQSNVDYAALFLKRLKSRHKSWAMAVARYHAGPTNHAAHKRYICAVIGHMVREGLGGWTPQARSYCA